jgi:Domain of unknown function (DUF6250)
MKIKEENYPRRARRKKIQDGRSFSCPSWIILFLFVIGGCAINTGSDPRFITDSLIFSDNFQTDSGQWKTELENGGSVRTDHGGLDIDVPAGATIWFKPVLTGPVMISYKAIAVSNGGANDRVSDLNCFWMARDSRNMDDLFAVPRTGKFADYNQLLTYYVGVGGNGNTTTRFRRYIGSATTRPLRPQDDLRQPADLLVANQPQTIQLIAANRTIEFYRDGRRLFEMDDDHPYTSGWFGFRTTASHLRITDFRVYKLTRR